VSQLVETARENAALIIDHIQVAIPEGEEARAREFFVDVLGMMEEKKPAKLALRGGCWFRLGACVVHVGIDPEFRPQKKGHPTFAVTDLDGLAERFESAGFDVRWDSELEGVSRFYVADPFGNRLEFLADGHGLSQRSQHMGEAV